MVLAGLSFSFTSVLVFKGSLFYMNFAALPECLASPSHPAKNAACEARLIQRVTRSSATAAHSMLYSRSQAFMRRRCFVLNRRRVLPESVLPSAVCVSGSSGFESDFSQQVFKFPAFCSTAFLFIGKVSGWFHRAAEIGIKVFGFGSGQRQAA